MQGDGRVYARGNNDRGQLGIGSYYIKYTPVPMVGLEEENITQMAAADNFVMALNGNIQLRSYWTT